MARSKQSKNREVIYPPGFKKANKAKEDVALLRRVLLAVVLKFQRSSIGLDYRLSLQDVERVQEDMELGVELRESSIYLSIQRKAPND